MLLNVRRENAAEMNVNRFVWQHGALRVAGLQDNVLNGKAVAACRPHRCQP
jgi:hypothetical protein